MHVNKFILFYNIEINHQKRRKEKKKKKKRIII